MQNSYNYPLPVLYSLHGTPSSALVLGISTKRTKTIRLILVLVLRGALSSYWVDMETIAGSFAGCVTKIYFNLCLFKDFEF